MKEAKCRDASGVRQD